MGEAGIHAYNRDGFSEQHSQAIERLKTTIPLWKKEVYAGGEEWIGRGS